MSEGTSTGVVISIIILYLFVFALIGLVIAVYFKEIPVVFGPTGPTGPSQGPTGPTGPVKSESGNIISPPPINITGQMSLMHWNPHWQCTTKSCCSNIATQYINNNIVSRQVDFANIIELETPGYTPPSGYQKIVARCGGDYTTIIYNTMKWTPVGSPSTFCINDAGNVGNNGRPCLIQKFTNSSLTFYVMGMHFTHFRDNYIRGIHTAFQQLGINSSDKIVFMADTNQNGTSEKLMTDMLQGTPSVILASPVRGTCCYNGPNSKFHLPYDRIITTIGLHMTSDFPTFNDIIPNPIAGCSYDEMHLPVFSVVSY